MTVRYLIVDDHKIFGEALELLLTQIEGMICVGQLDSPDTVLARCASEKIDLIFLDLQMPGYNGVDFLIRFRKSYPKIPVMVLTMIQDPVVVFKVMEAGANGYLAKNCSFSQLSNAVQTIINGGVYLDLDMSEKIDRLEQSHNERIEKRNYEDRTNQLSERELEILKLVAQGYTYLEIAEMTKLSPYTVRTHRNNINQKLGFKNSAAAIKYCTDMGII